MVLDEFTDNQWLNITLTKFLIRTGKVTLYIEVFTYVLLAVHFTYIIIATYPNLASILLCRQSL